MSKTNAKKTVVAKAVRTSEQATAVPVLSVMPGDVITTSGPAATASLNIQINTADIVDVAVGEYLRKLDPIRKSLQQQLTNQASEISASNTRVQKLANETFSLAVRKTYDVSDLLSALQKFTGHKYQVRVSGDNEIDNDEKAGDVTVDVDETTISGWVSLSGKDVNEDETADIRKNVSISIVAGSLLASEIELLKSLIKAREQLQKDLDAVDLAVRGSNKLASAAKQTITRAYMQGKLKTAAAVDETMMQVAMDFARNELGATVANRLLPA